MKPIDSTRLKQGLQQTNMAQLQREDMAVLSEVGLADNSKLSATEVTEILKRNHALPAGPHYDTEWEKFGTESDSDYYRSLTLEIYPHSRVRPYSLSPLLSDTCKQLRGRILQWFCDSSRSCSVFWITDPFICDLELSVVYTFACTFVALHRMGAKSQIRSKYGPQRSIFQVVDQLASRYPPYRGLLIRELADDPMILKKSPHILFKRLIVEPWDKLAASHPLYLQRPPLIILEFVWDPADTRDPGGVALIGLIQEYSNRRKPTPLLWLICTHPNDRQLNLPLLTIDAQPVYEHEAWTYDSAEAKQDVNDLLHCGFQVIRQKHPSAFVEDEKWPSDAQLARLADAIFGVSHFGCAVIRFVSAKGKDPKKQLETCIQYMAGCPRPSTLHPFSGLDHFYHQMVSNLPPRALDILRFSFPTNPRRNTCYMSNFLKIDRIELYNLISNNLDHLLTVCPFELRNYVHWLEFRDRAFDRFFRCACFSRIYSGRYTVYLPAPAAFSAIVSGMTWKPSRPKDLYLQVHKLRGVNGLLLWPAADAEDGGYNQWSKFDFRNLVPTSALLFPVFYMFLRRLKERQPKDEYPLVRTKPVFPSDHQFIEKCGTVAIPMCFGGGNKWPKPGFPQYALVGYGTQTVLIIMFWGAKPDRDLTSFNIYSLDMLDDL